MTPQQKQIKRVMAQMREAYMLLNEMMPQSEKQEKMMGIGEDYGSQSILKVVTEVFNVDPLIPGRKKEVIYARHAYRYFLRKHTMRSLQSIALLTNCEDHTVVIRSVNATLDLIETDPIFADLITKCEERI